MFLSLTRRLAFIAPVPIKLYRKISLGSSIQRPLLSLFQRPLNILKLVKFPAKVNDKFNISFLSCGSNAIQWFLKFILKLSGIAVRCVFLSFLFVILCIYFQRVLF